MGALRVDSLRPPTESGDAEELSPPPRSGGGCPSGARAGGGGLGARIAVMRPAADPNSQRTQPPPLRSGRSAKPAPSASGHNARTRRPPGVGEARTLS